MGYYEGEISNVGGGGNGGYGFDSGWWGIILIALLFGWGRGGYGGFGGNGGGSGSEMLGYELGKTATQADIASGFNNSAVLSNLNDIKLGQQTGFASIQNTLCQGFSGINLGITQSGYETRNSITDLGFRLQDCCCSIGNAMARNTCDIIQSGKDNTQRIIDYLTGEKISSLQSQNSALTAQLSQNAQTSVLLNAINRTPVAAYVVPNPYCCNSGCGNSAIVQ